MEEVLSTAVDNALYCAENGLAIVAMEEGFYLGCRLEEYSTNSTKYICKVHAMYKKLKRDIIIGIVEKAKETSWDSGIGMYLAYA